jgi:hypothetical protein
MTVLEAEQAIAAILRDLEIATGGLVEHISIRSTEITNFQSERAEYSRRVLIELKPKPGTYWATGRNK